MKKKVFLDTIKEILEEAFIGLTTKSEKNYIPQKKLSSEAYESQTIIYRARPIDDNKVLKKVRK